MLCYFALSFCNLLRRALEGTYLFIRSQNVIQWKNLSTHTITSSKELDQSYIVAFTIEVSLAKTPSQFTLRQHNHKQQLLVKRRLHFCLANTVRHLSMTWVSLVLIRK